MVFLWMRFPNLFFLLLKSSRDPSRTTRLEKSCINHILTFLCDLWGSSSGLAKWKIEFWSVSAIYMYYVYVFCTCILYMYYVYVLCICKNKNNNNNPRVLGARGGLERSNPAKETTHSGRGEKETHYMNVVGKINRWGRLNK